MFSKHGAMELSISTVVVIVLAMSMLVLGLVLVGQIFDTGNEIVLELDNKLKVEMNKLLSEEQKDVIVYAGSDGIVTVKAGTDAGGVAIAARTKDGSAVNDRNRIQYKISFQAKSNSNCLGILGDAQTKSLFKESIDSFIPSDEYDSDVASSLILIAIPESTPECSQKIYIDVKDTKTGQAIGGSSFILEIKKSGLF